MKKELNPIDLLAKHLECDVDDIDQDNWLIVTDSGADEKCKEEILSLVWAFRPSFLSAHSCLSENMIKLIQEKCLEDCNEELKGTIEDLEHFVNDAVNSDGRGHFLSHYDGNEIELGKIDDEYWFAYRLN